MAPTVDNTQFHQEKRLIDPTTGLDMHPNSDATAVQEGVERIVYTLGTSNRSLKEFVEILDVYGIQQVIDVRRFPTSRFDHFKKDNLMNIVERAGLGYLSCGDRLGGFRSGGYEEHMKTGAFQEALGEVETLARTGPAVILCAEKFPWKCHRRFIAAALRDRGWRVLHILDRDRTWQPQEQLDLMA